ncbi:MAG: hypothetical protein IKK21_04965, partial [Clostridia bacterium]|nr:hypothetical protein [Clostridia bacterium]
QQHDCHQRENQSAQHLAADHGGKPAHIRTSYVFRIMSIICRKRTLVNRQTSVFKVPYAFIFE